MIFFNDGVGMGMTGAGTVGDGDKYLSPCSSLVWRSRRGAENARPENDGPTYRGSKMQDWNMTDQIARPKNAGLDQINQTLVKMSIG